MQIVDKSRRSYCECSIKNSILRNFEKCTEKHVWQSLLFNKVASLRNSSTCVFLRILRNFSEHLLYRTLQDHCFCKWPNILQKSCGAQNISQQHFRIWKLIKLFVIAFATCCYFDGSCTMLFSSIDTSKV